MGCMSPPSGLEKNQPQLHFFTPFCSLLLHTLSHRWRCCTWFHKTPPKMVNFKTLFHFQTIRTSSERLSPPNPPPPLTLMPFYLLPEETPALIHHSHLLLPLMHKQARAQHGSCQAKPESCKARNLQSNTSKSFT